MKRIFKNKFYKVVKYTADTSSDCGILNGDDVHAVLKGFTYDEELEMYFNQSGKIGYDVQEVNAF